MAQRYRKVDPRIWTDENFVRLNCEGKLLALWLLTSPRVNRCGLVLWSPGLASEETGIQRDRIDTVYHTVSDTLNWTRDTVSQLVFLGRWWRYNAPDNESALKGALSDLHDVPRNNLSDAMRKASVDLPVKLQRLYHTVLDTVYHTVSYTVSPQEQEQEQETGTGPPECGVSVGFDPLKESERNRKDFEAAWNAAGLKPLKRLTHALWSRLDFLLQDPDWREIWRPALTRAGQSPFLARGEGSKSGPMDPSQFLRDDDFAAAIMRGKYDQRDPPKPSANGHGTGPLPSLDPMGDLIRKHAGKS